MAASYKENLTAAMDALATDPAFRVLGYGIKHGRAMGTLKNVPAAMLEEMPVAENLMTGAAIGMALAGFKPLVYVERADFLTCACDAIVNHLNAIEALSQGEFEPGVIIRVTIGNKRKPLFTGPVHTQSMVAAFRAMVSFPVVSLLRAEAILDVYASARDAQNRGESTMIFEQKDLL